MDDEDDLASLEAGHPARSDPLDKGDVVNIVGCLRRRLANHEELAKITDAQNRIIMRRIEEAGTWEWPRAAVGEQIKEIAQQVAMFTKTAEGRIRSLLAECLERARTDRRDGLSP
jgi:hypothetical protein